MTKLIIGLTGGIGSGKSQVSAEFARLGVTVVDADLIAREVVAKGSNGLVAIAQRFGSQVITEHGELDRAALRTLVFNDEAARQWLNNLTHPLIRQQCLAQCQAAVGDYALLVVPLMIENGFDQLVDRLLVIDVSEQVQRARTAVRDQVTAAEIDKIIARQASRAERLAAADDVLDNSGEIAELAAKVATLHQRYLALAQAS